jgi:multidrug transporter EmrE-like cation transporter
MKNLWIAFFAMGNLAAILTSNVGLKLSANAGNLRSFLVWQVFGNLTGFVGVLSFTALLRYVPLNVGFGVTGGLGFVLVQVVGARLLLREPIFPLQWLGTGLVVLGITLIAFGGKG